MTTDTAILKQIDWTQFTPLLIKADKVSIKKQKIDAKGVTTEDTHNWVLSEVEWEFPPVNTPKSVMRIKTVNEQGAPDNALQEEFDFLSGAFKFYYNTETEQIWGEIEVSEAGLPVTYRYIITFYGAQTVNSKDLLVNQSVCTQNGIKTINSVIAL